MRDLKKLREEIDNIDLKLVEMLQQRFEVVKEVGHYKKINNLPILDSKREAEVIESKRKILKDPNDFEYYKRIFELLMSIAKEMEK